MWIRSVFVHDACAGLILLVLAGPAWGQATRTEAALPEAPLVPPPPAPVAPAAGATASRGPDGDTLVAVHYTDAPLSTIFADVGKVGGMKFGRANDPMTSAVYVGNRPPVILKEALDPDFDQRRLTIDLDPQPYWIVVRELCSRIGAEPLVDSRTGAVTLYRAATPWNQLPWCASGPFLVVADSVGSYRTIKLDDPAHPARSLRVGLTVLADPALRVTMTADELSDVQAKDDQGHALLSAAVEPPQPVFSQHAAGWHISVPLAVPDDAAARIASLRGTVLVQISPGNETVNFADLRAHFNEAKAVGDVRVAVRDIQTRDRAFDQHTRVKDLVVGLDISWKAPATDDTVMQGLRKARIVDSKGNTVNQPGIGDGHSFPGGKEFSLYFGRVMVNDTEPGYDQPLPDPAKLILEMPGRVENLSVPVEFPKLNLPVPR